MKRTSHKRNHQSKTSTRSSSVCIVVVVSCFSAVRNKCDNLLSQLFERVFAIVRSRVCQDKGGSHGVDLYSDEPSGAVANEVGDRKCYEDGRQEML